MIAPFAHQFHSSLPAGLSREVIAYGGVIGVHLWSTISPVPPPERIACARRMGFWSSSNAASEASPQQRGREALRIGPLLLQGEKALPQERVLYREALATMLVRLWEGREKMLAEQGWYYETNSEGETGDAGAGSAGSAGVQAPRTGSQARGGNWTVAARLLAPYRTAIFARFQPLQPDGAGFFPNGTALPWESSLPKWGVAGMPRGWELRGGRRRGAGATSAHSEYAKPGGKCAMGHWVVRAHEDAAAGAAVRAGKGAGLGDEVAEPQTVAGKADRVTMAAGAGMEKARKESDGSATAARATSEESLAGRRSRDGSTGTRKGRSGRSARDASQRQAARGTRGRDGASKRHEKR